jgi:hypothetical protein
MTSEEAVYRIGPVAGKGLGVFATRDIKRGERIISESPLIVISERDYFAADVERAFNRLSDTDKARYMSLASAHNFDVKSWPDSQVPSPKHSDYIRKKEQYEARIAREKSLLSVYQTNNVEREYGSAVFDHFSRFNHSCLPNAMFAWNTNIGKQTVHALDHIPAGEEITVSYIDPIHSTNTRQYLLSYYGFKCKCPACQDTGTDAFAGDSTQRRSGIRELRDAIDELRPNAMADAKAEDALLTAYWKTVSLMLEEGLRNAEVGRK